MNTLLLSVLIILTVVSPLSADISSSYSAALGYRKFGNGTLRSGPEVGLTLAQYFTESVGAEARVGFVYTLNSSTERLTSVTVASLGGLWDFGTIANDYQSYGNAGIWAFFEGKSVTTDLYLGGGVRYQVTPSSAAKLELRFGFVRQFFQDVVIYLGFEKSLL